MNRHGGSEVRGGRTGFGLPQYVLGALGAVLVVAGVVEIVADGLVWVYVVHAVAGVVALMSAARRNWVKPGVLLVGAVFVILYIVESAAPDTVGDDPDPTSNASLIMTGVVLLVLLVAFMLPNRPDERR